MAAAKLNCLLSVRTRLIEDLDHHVQEVQKFTAESNTILISYRTTALEKALQDFVDTNEALEELTPYHALENLTEVKKKNREIQDQYLTAKLHIAQLVDNDADRTLNSSFFPPKEKFKHTQ